MVHSSESWVTVGGGVVPELELGGVGWEKRRQGSATWSKRPVAPAVPGSATYFFPRWIGPGKKSTSVEALRTPFVRAEQISATNLNPKVGNCGQPQLVVFEVLTCFVLRFQPRRSPTIPDLLDRDWLAQQRGKRDRVPQQLPTPLEHAPVNDKRGHNRCHDRVCESAPTESRL